MSIFKANFQSDLFGGSELNELKSAQLMSVVFVGANVGNGDGGVDGAGELVGGDVGPNVGPELGGGVGTRVGTADGIESTAVVYTLPLTYKSPST